MGTMVVERERKYELGDDERLPRLDEVPGIGDVSDPVRDKLSATYYDTADLRMARSGIALRRREGGPDAGWHLKVRSGPDTKIEHHAPISDQPPAELVEPLAGLLRGAPLAPVARITTARRRRQLLDR